MLVVRKSTNEDIEAIVDVRIKTWQTAYRGIINNEFLNSLDSNRDRKISERRKMYEEKAGLNFEIVAEYNGKIVGFAYFGDARDTEQYNLTDCGELYAIYVMAEYQRLGLGKMLFKTVERLLYEDGYTQMLIWTLERNKNKEFYKKMGGINRFKKNININNQPLNEDGYLFTDLRAGLSDIPIKKELEINSIIVKIFSYNSVYYQHELTLRDKVLRKPLGMNLFDEDLSQDEFDTHIGAFDGENLIGIILFTKVDYKTLKMRQVAVDNEYQGKGIGSLLVKFSEEYALKNGYENITMHARKNAVSFYEKLGYEIIGDEFMEVGIPHYRMDRIENLQV